MTASAGCEVSSVILEAVISCGLFINTVIDFLIVAFTIFMVIKLMNRLIN